jgi:AcrR family transcriptional regulator
LSEIVPARVAFGRYPCGEETRQRIIDTAVEIFGRQGFARTSTRDIAELADIKTPAIQYYFGSKLGLYDACIDQLTATVARRMTPELALCRTVITAESPLDRIVAALCQVQDCLIDSFFDGYEGHAIQRLLAWEDVESALNASDALMKERIGRPIFETYRTAVECVLPPPVLPAEAEIQAMALMGISMIFHANHNRVLDLINQPRFNEELLRTLKQVARRQVTFVLSGLAATPLPTIPCPAH